jgi:hypothetical protein
MLNYYKIIRGAKMNRLEKISFKNRLALTILLLLIFNVGLHFIPLLPYEHGGEDEMPSLWEQIFLRGNAGMLGLNPYIKACLFLTFFYYVLRLHRRSKKSGIPQSLTYVLSLLVAIVFAIAWNWEVLDIIKKFSNSPGSPSWIIFAANTTILFIGFILALVITRLIDILGIIGGVFALMILNPMNLLHYIKRLAGIFNDQSLNPPGPNQGLMMIISVVISSVIFIAFIIWLFRMRIIRDYFYTRLPMKNGGELEIPIFAGGLFFYFAGQSLWYYLIMIMLNLFNINIKLSGLLHFFTNRCSVSIFGIIFALIFQKYAIDWSGIKARLSSEISSKQLFHKTYLKLIYLWIFVTLIEIMDFATMRITSLRVIREILNLVPFLTLIMLAIFFSQWPWYIKMWKGKLRRVFTDHRPGVLLEKKAILAEAGINSWIRQDSYNALMGFMTIPLGEKALYTSADHRESANALLKNDT